MKFLIITHVEHKSNGTSFSAYAPYVREMNLWLKHVEDLIIVAPQTSKIKSEIDLDYKHENIKFSAIPSIQFTDLKNTLVSFFKIPIILIGIYKACKKADHIHLRCPGSIGLLGCLVQIFFPKKNKTAKYAGNWDPKAKQPLSYNIQKWLLSNTFLTKNMSVLVYGDWPDKTQNIKPFFTATFKRNEIEPIELRNYSSGLQFVFVGTLVEGKRPLLTIQIVERLQKKGSKVRLDIFGDGVLRGELEDFVKNKGLNDIVKFHGNQNKQNVKEALKTAHFSILPSKSEGWPKALAEAMFFGAIPIATSISCVPDMLGYGKRGILIDPDLDKALAEIERHLKDTENLTQMSQNAANWSQNYTLERFETEIVKLLKA
ncbi:glycosyltransferase family 4 protein [Tamlana crocina]|uniref:Glycosyltransferase family 4 protein n=1 Tax=Tamlana crocina TaxID=393006 RepID=A0ABX1D9K9_9FLAO|nr:glycosyltransferase family 4 protein [Tamlana crocina]NJX15055.1 glycosyltransferase family 4 protein [Tamlana crocina]